MEHLQGDVNHLYLSPHTHSKNKREKINKLYSSFLLHYCCSVLVFNFVRVGLLKLSGIVRVGAESIFYNSAALVVTNLLKFGTHY